MSRQEAVRVHSRIPGGNLKGAFQWAPKEYIDKRETASMEAIRIVFSPHAIL